MELISPTGLQFGVLAVLLALVAMAGFIAGIKVANAEHRRADAMTIPRDVLSPRYATERTTEPAPTAGAVVHVHLAAGMYQAVSPSPVFTASRREISERGA